MCHFPYLAEGSLAKNLTERVILLYGALLELHENVDAEPHRKRAIRNYGAFSGAVINSVARRSLNGGDGRAGILGLALEAIFLH